MPRLRIPVLANRSSSPTKPRMFSVKEARGGSSERACQSCDTCHRFIRQKGLSNSLLKSACPPWPGLSTWHKANIPILCVLALKNGCCFLGDVIRPDSLSESTPVVARQSQTLTAGLWVHQTSLTHRSAWSENSPMQGWDVSHDFIPCTDYTHVGV